MRCSLWIEYIFRIHCTEASASARNYSFQPSALSLFAQTPTATMRDPIEGRPFWVAPFASWRLKRRHDLDLCSFWIEYIFRIARSHDSLYRSGRKETGSRSPSGASEPSEPPRLQNRLPGVLLETILEPRSPQSRRGSKTAPRSPSGEHFGASELSEPPRLKNSSQESFWRAFWSL
jgi:hypothetical protein